MVSEDVKMEDAADAAAIGNPCSLSAETAARKQQSKGEGERKAEGAVCSDDEVMPDVCGDDVNGGAPTASAQTPASAHNGSAAADSAATTGGNSVRKATAERPTREDPAAAEKLRAYVASLGGTLPPGWMGVYRMRMGGNSAGQYDLCYRSPEGRMIRSRAEVLRILGLNPSGNAGDGGTGSASKKGSAGKTSKNDAGAVEKRGAPATGAEPAVIPAPGVRGGSAAGGSKWTLPLELPRQEALKAAKERAAELGLKPPFATDKGVTILDLGTFHKATGFYDATHIWPLGYKAAWMPPCGPPAAAAGPKKKPKKKEALTGKEGEHALEVDDGGEEKPKHGTETGAVRQVDAASAAEAQPPPYRFISEIRPGNNGTTGEGPSFAVLLEPNPGTVATGDGVTTGQAEPLLVHIATAPDVAWSAIADLQVMAAMLCKRAKPNGAGMQPTAMQRALAAMPTVGKVWGMDCFGLSDVRVLQLLEALPGVDSCEEYIFVQQRNSWELEATAIATKRAVVLSAAPNRRAAAAASKQRKRQQQLSIEAFVDRPPRSPNTDGPSEPAARDGLEDMGAAGTPGGAGVAPGTAKKSSAKSRPEGKTGAGGSGKAEKAGKMTRDDLEIRGVLDRLVERVSLVMAEPDEKERQKLLKAMEKSDRAAARRREKTAEKAAEKKAAVGGGTTPSTGAPDKEKTKKEKDKEKPPKPVKSRAKDKDAAGAGAKGAVGSTVAGVEAAPAAAPPLQLPGNQVDERTLPTAEVPAPTGLPLALYFVGADRGAEEAADAGTGAVATSLSTDEIQQLLSVYQFLWDHRKLLGMDGRVPSLADLLTVVSEPPARLPLPARRAADEVHLALVRLLVDEALDELLAHTAETSNLNRRDLSSAAPPITAVTWPELARRYMAAAATARYLATSEPRSSALASLQLPGQLQNLEPADWLHYLLAGLNFPHLLSRIALLPHASSRWAADALLAVDDARARAAAERALQGIKSFDLEHLDGEGQVRRGRRLLHALLTLPEGGEQLGFYAPEFSEVLRAPRGLDLHMVAARLDAGLYQSTGNWLQAISTDVRIALALWHAALHSPKGKDIPGHQDARLELADEAESMLKELLANPDKKLALPAPTAPADVATAPKAGADTEMQESGGSGGNKGAGKSSKSRKSRSSRSRKQQIEDGGQGPAEEDEGNKDPSSLDDPTRLFNPRDGCRVCWLDEDKNRILLCDGCDGEYHCYCVEPPLLEVPEGSWFCPSCTARGLGLPKAEDESEDTMDVDPVAERRGTPRATTPIRVATAAAAGGASVSPSDDSAPGLTPCSPAFQHCHSHSHLVSDLNDRAAARRPQSCNGHAAPDAAGLVLAVADHGCSGLPLAEVGEAPLSVPPDVPEGPRVTLRANSRPGLQELAGLLRLCHLLGNYDYATGGPVGGAASAGNACTGWTPARRLALLSALCELAMDTNALRSSLDDIVETRKKARVEANSIRSKARQIQEEQAAAKKAAAEKENAPKVEGDTDANTNAAAGTTAVAAGKGGKGGKGGGAKGSAKAKTDKTDKAAGAASKEAKEVADDEGAKEGVTKSRGKGRTDLSVLPEDELKRLMSLELQVEGLVVRQEALGEDRHGSRYWWLGADHLNQHGPQGVVLVEQLPTGHAIAEQTRISQAFSERQQALQVEEQARMAAEEKKKAKGAVGDIGETDGGDEQELDEWGLPKERPRPRTVAIGVDTIPGRSWTVFHAPEQLNTLIEWLNPKGLREGPLRTALLRARDRIAAPQVSPVGGEKLRQPAAAAAAPKGEQQGQRQQHAVEAENEGESGDALPLPLPQLLRPAVTLGTSGGRRGGSAGAAHQGSMTLPEANGVDRAVATDSPDAVALRTELLALHRGLPAEAFSRFWGSAARQEQWCAFVAGAASPQQLCAALTVLEAMLVDEAFRSYWRLYCMPAQHPELCTTWAAAWYRFGSLQGAIRKQIIPQRELRHQAMVETTTAAGNGKGCKAAAGKKEKAATGKKEQHTAAVAQERYPPRRGGSAAPPLPDISNVRSREAAALLGIGSSGKAHKDTGGIKGQKGASADGVQGQKRRRNTADDVADNSDDDEEDEENRANGRKRGKIAATMAAKDRIRQPSGASKAKGGAREQLKEGEVAKEEGESEMDGSDEESGCSSDTETSTSGSDDEEEDNGEDDVQSSDKEEEPRRKRKAQPSRASAGRKNKAENIPKTRRSSRLNKVKSDDDVESSSSDGEEERRAPKARRSSRLNKVESEDEEDSNSSESEEANAPAHKSNRRIAVAVQAAGRPKTRARVAAESDDEDSDRDEKGGASTAKGAQRRTRGGGSALAKEAKGTKMAMGSRAAAILANRKRALADWSEEESDGANEGKRSSDSGETSSSEDEPELALTAAVAARRGRAVATRAAPKAPANRRVGVGKTQGQMLAAQKAPSRRMARSEVEYDVEDFDDLNT
ncbi:hypothetical protein Vretimale_12325 [Volvox reticuliferus]|uniref:PHD-type domain-containing protein n=1 Tax=Volvox reticuliferus TaxID=1737510 RepID=A0A8J4FL60_9CHLO|nr:hypothetical protein Vretifemale_8934 [Volvox reticuliferus]GIM08245.1 hypothetical protein Vretimale_12325 [Volvox reticuliferus]